MAEHTTIGVDVETREDGQIQVTVHLNNWGVDWLTTLPQNTYLQSRIANHVGLSVMAHLRQRAGPDHMRI